MLITSYLFYKEVNVETIRGITFTSHKPAGGGTKVCFQIPLTPQILLKYFKMI